MIFNYIIVVSFLGSRNFSAALACCHEFFPGKQPRMPAQADAKGLSSSCTVLLYTLNLKTVENVGNHFLLKLKIS